ncbi:hypothetical protein E8E15_010871 [Penicillium rubens]|uniref:Uncharacterized protein n=1 Tax=Penicillium chrysogenum TaxID=5076 RepID=A0A167TFK8_PENCH|nr:uncharacterized protein N7525_006918 [Penicillium rubens]KAF3028300.1 hypothetical protein E8E15_010871 [Penicillium rubens]KAJ5828665.1 hypothetical protein N7525_006918 [Penicillium rubens]KAJ5841633.1 hypothetical protein N7534_011463 [Penicillium rubens]KZN88215.1 hypothetical protein EN45_067870 [Penicillium chrysogenum]
MTVSGFVWLSFLFCLITLIFLVTYRSPSLTGLAVGLDQETTPLMSPPVDKECVEQVYKYLFENATYIIDACGWIFIRFYIAWRAANIVMDEVFKPIVKSLYQEGL